MAIFGIFVENRQIRHFAKIALFFPFKFSVLSKMTKMARFAEILKMAKTAKMDPKSRFFAKIAFFCVFLHFLYTFCYEMKVLKQQKHLQNGTFDTSRPSPDRDWDFSPDLASKIFGFCLFPLNRNTPWPVGFSEGDPTWSPCTGIFGPAPRKPSPDHGSWVTPKSWKGHFENDQNGHFWGDHQNEHFEDTPNLDISGDPQNLGLLDGQNSDHPLDQVSL